MHQCHRLRAGKKSNHMNEVIGLKMLQCIKFCPTIYHTT